MNEEKEAARYLGYKGTPEPSVGEQIMACAQMTKELIPHSTSREFSLNIDGEEVEIGGYTTRSKALSAHLKGCDKVILYAATLGAKADRMLKQCCAQDMSMGAVMQACLAASLEAYCDKEQDEMAKEYEKQGLYLKPRFSPGYGDFDIHFQEHLLAMLDAHKKIGLGMTDSFMLTPEKSISAVIGVTREKQGCSVEKCQNCGNTQCAFRRTEE